LRAATTKTALGANRRPNITLVLACRNTGKAEQARQALVNEFYAGDEEEGLDAIQTQRLDLSDIKQVVRACDELKARFKRIHALVFNAGVLPVSSLSYWNGTKAFFTDPTNLAKTSADVIVQTVGMKTGDGLGLGEVFVANTLGHFGMLRELESVLEQTVVLERSEGREAFFAKVLWTSSTTAAPEFLDEADLQCLKGYIFVSSPFF
jgi:NAD(P)-dependent dehydrogenase (short-subunit alcohol dehydrogenase family)